MEDEPAFGFSQKIYFGLVLKCSQENHITMQYESFIIAKLSFQQLTMTFYHEKVNLAVSSANS